ncbi:F-box only protein 7 isoform 1-T2 [Synchiropus picturatus]
MKLKLRINKQSCRIDVPGPEPSLTDLINHIKEEVLNSVGLSPETDFSLSLNGSEVLTDTGQNLSSCGIVSGDLLYVILPSTALTDGAAVSAALQAGPDFHMSFGADNPSSRGATDPEEDIPSPDQQPCCSTAPLEYMEASPPVNSVSLWSLGPMICSEATTGQAPFPLELLYQRTNVNNPNEAIVVVMNILMLETGFTGFAASSDEMPDGWRSVSKFYKLSFQHQLCNNAPTVLVAVPIGPLLFVNVSVKVMSTDISRKLSLEATDYVTDKWPGKSAAAAYKDLRKLSLLFKDSLVYPLIAATREALCLPAAFGLTLVPPEVLLRILRMLDVQSLVRLSGVCKHLNTWASDSMLWRYMCYRDLKRFDLDGSRNPNWKEVYKKNCTRSFHRSTADSRFFFSDGSLIPPFPFNEELEPRDPIYHPPPFQPLWPFPDPFQPIPNPLRPLIDPFNPLPLRPRIDFNDAFPNRIRPPFSDGQRGRGHPWQRQGFR